MEFSIGVAGWALFLLVVSIVSGLGWDSRTGDIIYRLTGGLVNRTTAADLHTFVAVPIALLMLCHIMLKLRIFQSKK